MKLPPKEEDKTRTKCINPGCEELAAFDRTDVKGNKNWRIHCWRCHQYSYRKIKPNGQPVTLRPGVTEFKKFECCNKDGHLGFACIVDFTKLDSILGRPITEIDHKDGNHFNNDPSNLEELCKYCHVYKGKLNGDFNSQRDNSAKKLQQKQPANAKIAFNVGTIGTGLLLPIALDRKIEF